MDVLKKLSQESDKQTKQMSTTMAVVAATKLLDLKAAEDYNMLRGLGLSGEIDRAAELQSAKIERETFKSQYSEAFTVDELKAIAGKYALRFLRSDSYKGTISAEIPAKIREFAKKNKLDINKMDY